MSTSNTFIPTKSSIMKATYSKKQLKETLNLSNPNQQISDWEDYITLEVGAEITVRKISYEDGRTYRTVFTIIDGKMYLTTFMHRDGKMYRNMGIGSVISEEICKDLNLEMKQK